MKKLINTQSLVIQTEDDWQADFENQDHENRDEFFAGLAEFDVDRLICDICTKSNHAVYQDSYSDGVALINNKSYATYNDMADAFCLEIADYVLD